MGHLLLFREKVANFVFSWLTYFDCNLDFSIDQVANLRIIYTLVIAQEDSPPRATYVYLDFLAQLAGNLVRRSVQLFYKYRFSCMVIVQINFFNATVLTRNYFIAIMLLDKYTCFGQKVAEQPSILKIKKVPKPPKCILFEI